MPISRSIPAAWSTIAAEKLRAVAMASAYAARSASATMIGSAPISTTRACAIGSTGVGAVTANQASRRRIRSMLVPVKSIAG